MNKTEVDTREKIKTVEELHSTLEHDPWTVLVGEFEPVTPGIAAVINSLVAEDRRLLVIVKPNEAELLSTHARTALMAAFRGVDAVLVENSDRWRRIIGNNPKVRVIEDTAFDQRTRLEFEELVFSRQTGAAGA
jgi:hypothetical protein